MIFGALCEVQADLSSLCSQNLNFHSYFSLCAQAIRYQLNLTLNVAEKIWGPEMYFPSGLQGKVEESNFIYAFVIFENEKVFPEKRKILYFTCLFGIVLFGRCCTLNS